MNQTKEFPTEAVVSAVSGIMLVDDFGEIYEVLNFLLEDNLFTHELPAACDRARPYIYARYPWMADLDLPPGNLTALNATMSHVIAEHGPTLTLTPLKENE